jgi:hypothetical protein
MAAQWSACPMQQYLRHIVRTGQSRQTVQAFHSSCLFTSLVIEQPNSCVAAWHDKPPGLTACGGPDGPLWHL